MDLTHNQWAYVAIVSTLIVGSLFVGADGLFRNDIDFEEGASDITAETDLVDTALDSDGDGLQDRVEESQYGTDKFDWDTDGDGLSDGWEVMHGLNPLDSGDASEDEFQPDQSDESEGKPGEQNETWPDPNSGPLGDPDHDGLSNTDEYEIGTNPNRADTDGDGLNDRWEWTYSHEVQVLEGTIILLNPLDGNWDCSLLTPEKRSALETRYGTAAWEAMADDDGRFSCDYVLDLDGPDGLPNYLEEQYSTNPLASDSDGDLIPDVTEIAADPNTEVVVESLCGLPLIDPVNLVGPFAVPAQNNADWFLQDLDGDGRYNGPSDWDSDGDGMPDGFEYCYSELLDPSNSSDAYGDPDDDGLNNLEEYLVALSWGVTNFTDPNLADTDGDEMPDGWESSYGLNPRDGSNGDQDPDLDGWDMDSDGSITFDELEYPTKVSSIQVEVGDWVEENETVARAQITLPGGNKQLIPLVATSSGTVYEVNVEINEQIESRQTVWLTIVEREEMFTNILEYTAREKDGDGNVDGRSTDPLNPDTDGDGLKDGIEVMGWHILVVSKGVKDVLVTSDPGMYDTDGDGLSDWREFSETFTNASNADTDGDGLEDYTEAVDGFFWEDEVYHTSPTMFDTDNDALEDGEEIIAGRDQYVTHANMSDTDDDGLRDGWEVLFVPRPFQEVTNPLVNDTDSDGMFDGWEMQIESMEDNTRSHSLWVSLENWLPPNCENGDGTAFTGALLNGFYQSGCGAGPGGFLWNNWLRGFSFKYEVSEMNLTGFTMPEDSGRWALDPSFGSLPDSTYDVDNDTLVNSQEAPDRWNTNPVDFDTDQDGLPDGWEVKYSEMALLMGLVSNDTYGAGTGFVSRGPMDPAMDDSDLDGIKDGEEDPDGDGLNRTQLIRRYCPGHYNPQSNYCHIDPDNPGGKKFYDDLENYTNYEEYINGTYPVLNDSDGDNWEDGSEVYHQDHDDDSMASGWEYYFELDPFDAADSTLDSDGDGYENWCEFKWDTNPRDQSSFPSQGQHCDLYT